MNLFAWSGLLSGIGCTLMAGLVYFSTPRRRVTRLWALFCVAVSVWGFGSLLIGLTPDDADIALVWWRLTHVGVICIPVLFYHFVTAFTDVRRPKTLGASYALGTVFLVADATPLFVAGVRKVFGEFYYDAPPGILYIPFVVFFLGLITASHVELWRSFRRTRDLRQRRLIQWLCTGTAIGFIGGATCFLPVFGVDVYPLGNFAVPLFPLLMTYAFLRYRLVDVNMALARGLAFLVIYAVVVVLPFAVGHRYQAIWESVFGAWWWAAPVVLMGLLASTSPVLFLLLVRRLEHGMLKAQRRYHRTLITASSGMTRVKDLTKLCRLIVYVVNRAVGLTNCGLFLLDAKGACYRMTAVRYQRQLPPDLTVPQADPVIDVLRQDRNLLMLEELEAFAAPPKAAADWLRKWEAAYAWMRRLEVRLIVPSFTNEGLLGFLALGAKRSGEPYTTDDIAIFSGLANQATLGIENALFFEERKTHEAHMIQSEKLASLGQLASGMAHEIHNPLTIISGEAQLYLERFRGKDSQVDTVLHSIIEECHRAADITRRILRFAKPAPSELASVDLRSTIEESLTLAGYQGSLDRVERRVDCPADLPKVKGNQNQLQEVFLNLILNACQAMGKEGGKLEVVAAASNGQVDISVKDTGPGIPANKILKIFDPFFTTKPTGTGLGLFVSQRIIRSHGGSLDVDSTEGKGTTFTIHLPVAPQEPVAGPPAG